MAYFRCTTGGSGKGNTLVVTCADDLAGATITCTNGTKTYTKTCPSTAPYEVTFYGLVAGTWTVSATVSGNTYTTTVVITDYEAELGGFNWKTWVDLSENYTSSDFTDLDDLLSDETAIRELMTIHACVDYLADIATTSADVETIIGNDLCAKWINLRDYALDTLYANTIIKALMDEADKYFYGEWALVGQVPNMTSNTAPYGEAFSSTDYSSQYVAYKAFDNDNSTRWNNAENHTLPDYVGYKFPSQICVKKAHIKLYRTTLSGVTYTYGKDIEIIARNTSNDEWTILESYTFTNTDGGEEVDISFDNTNEYREYAVKFKTSYVPAGNVSVYSLQFYAYAPKGNVPVMTSNTAPYGEAFGSSKGSGDYYMPFRCKTFGEVPESTSSDPGYIWGSEGGADPVSSGNTHIGFKFTNPTCVKRVAIGGRSFLVWYQVKAFRLYGSNDNGATWEQIGGTYNTGIVYNTKPYAEIDIENDKYYLCYKVNPTETYGDDSGSNPENKYVYINFLQFYGRELTELVPTMTSNTTPYGEAVGTQITNEENYRAFDNNDGTYAGTNTYNGWTGYKFVKPTCVKFVKFRPYLGRVKNYSIDVSSDGNTWTPIKNDLVCSNVSTNQAVDLENDNDYLMYRLNNGSTWDGNGYTVYSLQFYGFDYSEKEFEEGTTKKWLYDHGVELVEMSIYNSQSINPIVKNNDNYYFTATTGSSSTWGNLSPVAKIDFTGKSLVRVKCRDYFAPLFVIAIAENRELVGSISFSSITTNDNIPNNACHQFTSLNDLYYIGVRAQNADAKFDLVEWWLE